MHRLIFATCLAGLASPALAEVPMSYAQSGHITVPVLVNGKGPFAFVLDTGAEGTAVYARFAAEQGWPAQDSTETLVGQTGSAAVPLIALDEVMVDRFAAQDVSAVRLDDRKDGVPLAGILGLDVIGGKVIDIDFKRMAASLLTGAEADAAINSDHDALQAQRVLGGLLAIPVKVNGAAGVAIIDTGARETRVNSAFARAAGLQKTSGGPDTKVYGATNVATTLSAATADAVNFASVGLVDVQIRVADLAVFEEFGLKDQPAMLLGADYLKGRRLVVDFRSGLVAFR